MDGIASGGGPIGRGAERISGWPRLKPMVALMMGVARRRFLSDGGARKADRQSDRSDKAFDHGAMFPTGKRRISRGCSNSLSRLMYDGRLQRHVTSARTRR